MYVIRDNELCRFVNEKVNAIIKNYCVWKTEDGKILLPIGTPGDECVEIYDEEKEIK